MLSPDKGYETPLHFTIGSAEGNITLISPGGKFICLALCAVVIEITVLVEKLAVERLPDDYRSVIAVVLVGSLIQIAVMDKVELLQPSSVAVG